MPDVPDPTQPQTDALSQRPHVGQIDATITRDSTTDARLATSIEQSSDTSVSESGGTPDSPSVTEPVEHSTSGGPSLPPDNANTVVAEEPEARGNGTVKKIRARIPGSVAFGDAAIVIVCLLALFLFAWLWRSRSERSDLRIIPTRIEGFQTAAKDQRAQEGTIAGIVVLNDEPCAGASVLASGTDGFGNKVGVFVPATKEDGTFLIKMAPPVSSIDPDHMLTDVQLVARKREKGFFSNVLDGNLTVKLKRGGIIQDFKPELRDLVLILFATSLALAIFIPSTLWASRLQHFASICITCALSASVVYAFGYGMSLVDDLPERDAARLGFATIFRDTYVADLPAEWLVSLTSPPDRFHKNTAALISPTSAEVQKSGAKTADVAATQKAADTVSGVGAPLWFLFLGTIGAMLLTFDLVVTEIGAPTSFTLDADSQKELRHRLRKYVQHSFFVLFSPFAGLFVYQLLAETRACASPIFVGIIALGTGPILPLLLERGVRQALQVLQPSTERNGAATASNGGASPA